jgi:hypothetical protein
VCIYLFNHMKIFSFHQEIRAANELGDLMNPANENAMNRHTAEPTVAVP